MEKSIEETLKQRLKVHGDFTGHAEISCNLKHVMHSIPKWYKLSKDKREALDMIVHKVARILNGDADHADHWHDIAGYATLAEKRCKAT